MGQGPQNSQDSQQAGMEPSLLDAAGARKLEAAARNDMAAPRCEYLFAPPAHLHKPLARLLEDSRDLPIFFLYLNVLLTTVPAVAALFWFFPAATRPLPHWLGAAYMVANLVLYLGRFMLSLHYSQHRRLFRKDLNVLNFVAPVLFAPIYGVPSGMYHMHHCLMHHCGNNGAAHDASSTERYQRDSFLAFLGYYLRFALGGWIEVPLRCLQYGRRGLLAGSLIAEGASFYVTAAAWQLNPRATLWVLLLPYFITSLALMFGNWSQHIFVDPSNPHDSYRLTYNCAGVYDNRISYNDGYHILHHLNARLHWSEMPARFVATLEQHAAHDALCFEGVHFMQVGAAVMAGKYDFLLRHLSRYSAKLAAMDDAQIVQMLKARLVPIRT